jgi:hypothetical protein
MRCEDCRLRIEEYFDRELDEQTAFQVKGHLDDCALCSRLLQGLMGEHDVYACYTPDVEIRPELWSNVRARIALTSSASKVGALERLLNALKIPFVPPRISVWTTAALVIAAVGLTIVVMRYAVIKDDKSLISVTANSPKPTPAIQTEVVTEKRSVNEAAGDANKAKASTPKDGSLSIAVPKNPRPRSSVPSLQPKTPNQLVQEAEQKYLAAIALLSRTAERKRSRLDPGTQAKLEQAIVSIDRTIAATRKVVRQHPDDPVAVQYMLNAYSRKVDVLRGIIGY